MKNQMHVLRAPPCKYCSVFNPLQTDVPYDMFIEAIMQIASNLAYKHQTGNKLFYCSIFY